MSKSPVLKRGRKWRINNRGGTDNLPYEQVGKGEPVCIADQVPFEIPENWEWVRLCTLVSKEIRRGKSPKYSSTKGIQVFAQKCNAKSGSIDMSLAKYLDPIAFTKYPTEEYLQDQDIIVNSTGNGTLGRIGVFRDADRIDDSVIVPDSHVTVIRLLPSVDKDYLLYVLRYYQPYLEKLGEGSTNQTELKPSIISDLFIPIPPINEQNRIADRLVTIFPLINAYGKKETALSSLQAAFPDQLKKSILQMAVQGKLVPQDPADEPASVLLERIRAEKERLIKAGKIKRDKHESIIFRRDNSHYERLDGVEQCIDDELPFDIPESWVWVRLQSLALTIVDCPHSTPPYCSVKTNYCAIDTNCIAPSGLITSWRYVDKATYLSRIGRLEPKENDIVYTREGSICRAAILPGSTKICLGQRVMLIRCPKDSAPRYIRQILMAPQTVEVLTKTQKGIGAKHINVSDVCHLLIPLPPLAEQHRIVAKIEEILPMIKTL